MYIAQLICRPTQFPNLILITPSIHLSIYNTYIHTYTKNGRLRQPHRALVHSRRPRVPTHQHAAQPGRFAHAVPQSARQARLGHHGRRWFRQQALVLVLDPLLLKQRQLRIPLRVARLDDAILASRAAGQRVDGRRGLREQDGRDGGSDAGFGRGPNRREGRGRGAESEGGWRGEGDAGEGGVWEG